MGRAGIARPVSMTKTERIKEAIDRLLDMFESGDLPAAIARTVIKGDARPCDKWSLGNRLLILAADTDDARGFRQWQEVGRKVKKGAKAIYIFAPKTRRKITSHIEIDPNTGEEQKIKKPQTIITGFKNIPVFRMEDTEGEPLPDYTPPEPPPLFGIAKQFVKDVKYKPFIGMYYGYFSPTKEEIVLNTHDAKTFFHELAHAVHHQIKPGGLKGGQHADQEIVAETVACTLCEMYGYSGYIWQGWQSIQGYAGQDSQQASKAVMGVLSDVEKVLDIIIGTAEKFKEEGVA